MVRLTDRPDMTLDVYRGRITTIQQQQQFMGFQVRMDLNIANDVILLTFMVSSKLADKYLLSAVKQHTTSTRCLTCFS